MSVSNLLVTGGCGFIGSNFINYIFNKNKTINIINIDALYYSVLYCYFKSKSN
jgi:dTDP-glucose 4,6-dehydratase